MITENQSSRNLIIRIRQINQLIESSIGSMNQHDNNMCQDTTKRIKSKLVTARMLTGALKYDLKLIKEDHDTVTSDGVSYDDYSNQQLDERSVCDE